jgi:hypothetical protein
MLKVLYMYIFDIESHKGRSTGLCIMGLLRRINQHNGRLQQFSALAVMLFRDTVLLDLLHLRDRMSGNKQQVC